MAKQSFMDYIKEAKAKKAGKKKKKPAAKKKKSK